MLGASGRINLLKRGKTLCQLTGIARENRVREGRYHQPGNSLFRPHLGWLHLRQIETTRSNHSEEDRRIESSRCEAELARQDGASPSRMARRRSGPIAPMRCKPAARTVCTGSKLDSSERLARSITKVRLATSARRAEA